LLGLKNGIVLGGTSTLAPVFGLCPNSAPALSRAEAAEAPDFNAVAALQRAEDTLKNSFHHSFGFFAWKICDLDNFFDEVRFCHGGISHCCMLRQLPN